MLSMLAIATALAANGELVVEVEGSAPLTVHVDGKRQGAGSDGKPVKVSLPVGRHEVAVSYDNDGLWLLCVGDAVVSVNGVKVVAGTRSCTGIDTTIRVKDTVVKGGLIAVAGADAHGVVDIDGAEVDMVSRSTLLANVTAGTHTVRIGKLCTGPVTLKAGEKASVVVAGDVCKGFDEKKKKK